MACSCLMCIAEGDNSPHRLRAAALTKRPVAFRVPRLFGDMVSHWFLTESEDEARAMADTNAVEYEGLYNRNPATDAQPPRAPCNCRYPGSLGGDCDGSCQCPEPNDAASLTERLIQAAVDYESGRCSRRELSEARAAVESAMGASALPLEQSGSGK